MATSECERLKRYAGFRLAGLMTALFFLGGLYPGAARAEERPRPVIVKPWAQIAGDPDLGELTSAKQQPVDFAIWQAADGTWQLWSCIRGTKEAGHTRLFHRWEGTKLTDGNWKPMGVAMRADPRTGELAGGLQAPHVIKADGGYVMFY